MYMCVTTISAKMQKFSITRENLLSADHNSPLGRHCLVSTHSLPPAPPSYEGLPGMGRRPQALPLVSSSQHSVCEMHAAVVGESVDGFFLLLSSVPVSDYITTVSMDL